VEHIKHTIGIRSGDLRVKAIHPSRPVDLTGHDALSTTRRQLPCSALQLSFSDILVKHLEANRQAAPVQQSAENWDGWACQHIRDQDDMSKNTNLKCRRWISRSQTEWGLSLAHRRLSRALKTSSLYTIVFYKPWNRRIKNSIHSQLNSYKELYTLSVKLTSYLGEKLSKLRSFDRQLRRPQNCPFQSSFTYGTAQFTQGIPRFPQFTCRHHHSIISRHKTE